MLFKKGIVRRTFLFSISLILIVVLVSFAAMYFTMPSYYLSQKETSLKNNLKALTASLQATESETECAALIADFSERNNVNVLAFDAEEMLLPTLSTPFLGLQGAGSMIYMSESHADAGEGQKVIFQIRKEERLAPDTPETGLTLKLSHEAGIKNISIESHIGTQIVEQILVNSTLQPIDEAKGVIFSLLPYVLIIAVMIGLILSGIYAKQISKPILQISDAALRMQCMEPDAASGIRTKDELGQLSANLDALYASLRENIGTLQCEMDKVSRLERSKTEMMQSASHELKTPIAALNGMIEGMVDNVGAYKNKDIYLVECKKQVDKLSLLVSEILIASRADIGTDSLDASEICVDDLVQKAISENRYQLYEKDLRLEQNLPPTTITTDSNMLYHALSNLISNAVRYTPQGGAISVSITETETARRLCIENESEPIPPEEFAKLFEPFYTRSHSRDKTVSGTGLGLYIVKRNLERLGIPYEAGSTDTGFRICLMLPAAGSL